MTDCADLFAVDAPASVDALPVHRPAIHAHVSPPSPPRRTCSEPHRRGEPSAGGRPGLGCGGRRGPMHRSAVPCAGARCADANSDAASGERRARPCAPAGLRPSARTAPRGQRRRRSGRSHGGGGSKPPLATRGQRNRAGARRAGRRSFPTPSVERSWTVGRTEFDRDRPGRMDSDARSRVARSLDRSRWKLCDSDERDSDSCAADLQIGTWWGPCLPSPAGRWPAERRRAAPLTARVAARTRKARDSRGRKAETPGIAAAGPP